MSSASASDLPLAYSHENYIPRCTAHPNGHRPASPYIGAEVSKNKLTTPLPSRAQSLSSFQQQPIPTTTLFSDLLFNREQVYGGSPVPCSHTAKSLPVARIENSSTIYEIDLQRLPVSTADNQKDQEDSTQSDMLRVLSQLRGMAPVSNKTGGTKKREPTEGKASETKPRKRPASRTPVGRPKKEQKTDADSKKKVEGPTKGHFARDLIVIDSESDDDNSMLEQSKAAKKSEGTWLIPSSNDWDFSRVDSSETEPDLQPLLAQVNLENKLARVEAEHATEVQRLRKELEDAKAETESVRRHMQKKLDDAELQHAKAVSQSDRKYATLERELIRERANLTLVAQERDQFYSRAEAEKTRSSDLTQELQEQQRLNDQAEKDHTHTLENLIKTKDTELAAATSSHQEQLSILQADNTRLKQEVEAHIATAASALASQTSTISASSPAPSSAYTVDEDIKTDNVRKTYVKVKRRFDNLHAVAVNLARCTRGMDLTSFGEFGKYAKQLRKVLDEDGQERQGMAVVRSSSREEEHRFEV